jgi:hypothetical protein
MVTYAFEYVPELHLESDGGTSFFKTSAQNVHIGDSVVDGGAAVVVGVANSTGPPA